MKRALLIVLLAACSTPTQTTSNAASKKAPPDSKAPVSLAFSRKKPALAVQQPAAGAFVARTSDGLVSVSGTADSSGVSINGREVSVADDGTYATQIYAQDGLNVLFIEADGIAGAQSERAFLYGDIADASASFPNALALRLNAAGYDNQDGTLDNISAVLSDALEHANLLSLIPASDLNVNLGVGSVDVAINSLSYGTVVTDLVPIDAGLSASGSIANINIGMTLTINDQVGVGSVTVDTVGFSGDIMTAFDPSAQAITANMGTPTISIGKITVVTGLGADEDQLMNTLATLFHDQITFALEEAIATSGADNLALSLNQFSLPASFNLSALNATLDTSEAFSAGAFDSAGSTLAVTANLSAPGAAGPGSITFGNTLPALSNASPVVVSLAIDLLNQAIAAIWVQGALEQTVTSQYSWGPLSIAPITVTPTLPPIVTANNDGTLTLSLGDLVGHTTLSVLGWDANVQVTMSAVANVTASSDGKSLTFTLNGNPQLWIDVNSLLGIVPDAVLSLLSDALDDLAPAIVANYLKPISLQLPTIPLDQVPGLQGETLSIAGPVTVTPDVANERISIAGGFVVTP